MQKVEIKDNNLHSAVYLAKLSPVKYFQNYLVKPDKCRFIIGLTLARDLAVFGNLELLDFAIPEQPTQHNLKSKQM